MSDEKITHLEEVLMHQEQQITALSEAMIRQWNEIDLLKKHIRKLEGDVAHATEAAERLSPSEQSARDKPPHY